MNTLPKSKSQRLKRIWMTAGQKKSKHGPLGYTLHTLVLCGPG
jgi:hypothetical protein